MGENVKNSSNGSQQPFESSELILSTDPRPRLRWTADLHQRFVDAVTQIGGPEKATPKSVMRIMGVEGLTLYHLKSHLQKYRLGKLPHREVHVDSKCREVSREEAATASDSSTCLGTESQPSSTFGPSIMTETLQICEALRLQIEVQRRLHEQLEVQRHLQLRIEAQGKYLQSILEKARETLAKHHQGSTSLKQTQAELVELSSQASAEFLNPAISLLDLDGLAENQGLLDLLEKPRKRQKQESEGDASCAHHPQPRESLSLDLNSNVEPTNENLNGYEREIDLDSIELGL